jgi:16S rRNA (uracil1498-N3)-methyltransferase
MPRPAGIISRAGASVLHFMTRRRFIADEVSGNVAALTGAHAAHLIRVLRTRVGQEFDVAAGGVVRRGRVAAIAEGRVELELGEELPTPATTNVTLLLAIFKFDRMEWAIEKCTELGVSRIAPVIASRTDAHLAAAAQKRAERWRRIAVQAFEQSRRANPPEIAEPVKLRSAINSADGLRIVLAETEHQTTLRDLLASPVQGAIYLAIGPEGGWAEDELEAFQKAGWISASLGATILRAETAAIAATAITITDIG